MDDVPANKNNTTMHFSHKRGTWKTLLPNSFLADAVRGYIIANVASFWKVI